MELMSFQKLNFLRNCLSVGGVEFGYEQGRREPGRGPWQIFLEGPCSKIFFRFPDCNLPRRRQLFRENSFPDEYIVNVFVGISCNFFISNFVSLPEKHKYFDSKTEVFRAKNDWGNLVPRAFVLTSCWEGPGIGCHFTPQMFGFE